jgi:stringent starvation protein B
VTDAAAVTMNPRRPYLLRAIHEWISDSNCTPHLVVDAGYPGVEVPRQYVKDGKIVLNVSWTATAQLKLGNDEVSFSARFGGSSMNVRVPVAAVLAIYARETGQGMIFSDDDAGPPAPAPSPPSDSSPEPSKAPSSPNDQRRAKFKVVK